MTRHEALPHGRLAPNEPARGHGFNSTSADRKDGFGCNSGVECRLQNLHARPVATFAVVPGGNGPQPTIVRPIGKHRMNGLQGRSAAGENCSWLDRTPMKMRHQSAAAQSHPKAFLFAAVAVLCLGWAPETKGQNAALQGTWNGSGRVELPSGDTERARCRATFRQQSGGAFSMSAVCATASTRIAQVARVQQVTAGVYEGQFHNQEYDVSGTIRITVRGERLSAILSGGGGRASFNLTK